MKVEKIKHKKGWRVQLTDDAGKQIWQGNIEKTQKAAKAGAIEGFINDKLEGIRRLKAHKKSLSKRHAVEEENAKAAIAMVRKQIRELKKL